MIESKAVLRERIDAFLREKIEMVGAKEANTKAGEAWGVLDRTFRGGDMDEVEPLEGPGD